MFLTVLSSLFRRIYGSNLGAYELVTFLRWTCLTWISAVIKTVLISISIHTSLPFRALVFYLYFKLLCCVRGESEWKYRYLYQLNLSRFCLQLCQVTRGDEWVHMFLYEPDHRPYKECSGINQLYNRSTECERMRQSFKILQHDVVGSFSVEELEHFCT